MTQRRTCRVCNAEDLHPSHTFVERMFGLGDEFRYFECLSCGCLQIEEVPACGLEKYYGTAYFSSNRNRESIAVRRKLREKRDAYALNGRGLVGRLVNFITPNGALESIRGIPLAGKSVLDVGSSRGGYLRALMTHSPSRVLGIDLFVDEEWSEGALSVRRRTVWDVEGEWDLVMLHHSLEHMENQRGTVRRLFELLKPGGTCVIRIPLFPSHVWDQYGSFWVGIDAPRHLFIHSRRSFELLCKEVGFEPPIVRYDSTAFQFWGSEQYRLGIPLFSGRSFFMNPLRSVFSPADIVRFHRRAAEVNASGTGDQAAFYLKRPGS